ncbi:MAG: hypothetical protein KGL95_08130 [Patescibacteria group bacterium]|nr:hypothetical protein [Patescibacteria group bacterium]
MLERKYQIPYDSRLPRRVDWKKVQDIVGVLYNNGKLKTTPMSTICEINYRTIVKYLFLLETLEMIRYVNEDGFKLAVLTTRGIEYHRRNLASSRTIEIAQLD